MTLGDLIPSHRIKLELASQTRWQAITEMLDILAHTDALGETLLLRAHSALEERERSMSTGIGDGIAIPHATVEGLPDVLAAFGRSKQGIDFDAIDMRPVKLVVLFLVPQGQFSQRLDTLAVIAKYLNRPAHRSALLHATSVEEAYAVFAKATDSL